MRKGLAVFGLVYNLVRVVMLEAAARQGVAVARVSFTDALKWMRHARPGDRMPKLLVNPARPDRAGPRCVKRRPKQFDLTDEQAAGRAAGGAGRAAEGRLTPPPTHPAPSHVPFD